MDRAIWNLPGPSEYIKNIRLNLQDGKNIVFLLPSLHPPYLKEMVANISRENERSFRPLNLEKYPSSMKPHEILYEEFISSYDRHTKPLLPSIIENPHFSCGMVIWINDLNKAIWDIWRPFIIEYEHSCRNIPEYDRSVFCIPLTNELVHYSCDTDVALSSHKWSGFIDRSDVWLYVSQLIKQRSLHPLHRKVILTIIIELAGFDLDLAKYLATTELEILLNPFQLLAEIANNRGWDSYKVNEPSWHEGMIDVFEGTELISAALIACSGDKKEIERRVWKGQVAVLFPYIEEQRINLLPELKPYLKLPFDSHYGMINDIQDLELGHILHLIVKQKKRINPDTFRQLKYLTEMRRALAHLEPVPIKYLLADVVLNI